MYQSLEVFGTAMAMSRHAGQRQALSAQNIANADTPGYRARFLPDFREALAQEDFALRATRGRHLHGGPEIRMVPSDRRDQIDPNGNTVSLELEMIEAVEAKRQHDRAMAIYRNAMSILRTAASESR